MKYISEPIISLIIMDLILRQTAYKGLEFCLMLPFSDLHF